MFSEINFKTLRYWYFTYLVHVCVIYNIHIFIGDIHICSNVNWLMFMGYDTVNMFVFKRKLTSKYYSTMKQPMSQFSC